MSSENMKDSISLAKAGAIWTFLGYGGSQLIRLISNLLLAWFLFPGAFGLMALINVLMQGLEMFSDIGLGPSIIRNPRGEDSSFLNTAWTIQIIRGFLLWLVACLISVPFADFYSSTDPLSGSLLTLLPVASFVAVISGFNSTGVFLLNRQMNLKLVTALEIIPQAVSALVMVIWAVLSPSVWALVVGNLAGSITKLGLSHLLNPGPPNRLGLNRDSFRDLFHFGKWIFLSTLVTFLSSNLDRLMLGKSLSLGELGVYSIALTFARIGIHIADRLSSTVIFPLLSRLQGNPQRVVLACLRSRQPILWISGVGCVGFSAIAPLFFGQLYDNRYAGAGLIAQWLALFVWSHILNISMDRIVLALGNSKQLFTANLIKIFTLPLSLVGYKYFGIPGFIAVMSLSNLTAHIYLVKCLPFEQVKVLLQGLWFTLGMLIYALPLLIYFRESDLIADPLRYLLYFVAGLTPLAAIGYLQVLRSLQKRKTESVSE